MSADEGAAKKAGTGERDPRSTDAPAEAPDSTAPAADGDGSSTPTQAAPVSSPELQVTPSTADETRSAKTLEGEGAPGSAVPTLRADPNASAQGTIVGASHVTAAAAAPAALPWALIAFAAVVPIAYAVLQLGRWHPDEVWQYLEPAYRRVHNYGFQAWEWNVGLRNWATPIVFSWCLRLAHALGIDHPHGYRAVVALPQLALQVAMLVAVWRYMERRLAELGRSYVTFAFLLVAAFAPVLILSGRTMGESLSVPFLVIACDRLDRRERPWLNGGIAGAMLGLSVVVRYGSAVFVVAALVWVLATRRWKLSLATMLSGAVIAAGLAALDWDTWGKPFHSLLTYTQFNVISGDAARRFGESPWWYYLPLFGLWIAAWAWPGLIAGGFRERRVPLPAFMALAYFVAISATPHKEDRFIYPGVVLFSLAGAAGVAWLVSKLRRRAVQAAVAGVALAAGFAAFAFAPEFRGDQFRAQIKATRDPSVTGLLIVGEGLWGSGGHFYIGRNIPFYNADLPHHIQQVLRGDKRVNRVITFNGLNIPTIQAEGFEIVDRVGRETILARKK